MCQSGDTHCAAMLKNKKTLLEKLSKQKTTTINLLSTGGELKTEIMKNKNADTAASTKPCPATKTTKTRLRKLRYSQSRNNQPEQN